MSPPRVRLRRLAPGDLDVFAAYRADEGLARYQGWSPMSRDESLAFLQEMQTAPAYEPDCWFQIGVADAATDRLIGDMGVRIGADGVAEVGITLERAHHGRGLATEALAALLEQLFARPEVQAVRGIADARNTASLRLLQRAGLQHVDTQDTVFRGEPCVEWVFERRRG